ncbi:carbohydrate ABC transporter permease [Phytoactinopolyspora mesophila]|uniref:carbohydrate ABC transporter permease n=1 Tax=Phytoactinopolyspora mesophila TaxID=2650750 RepID=UPI001C9E2A8C
MAITARDEKAARGPGKRRWLKSDKAVIAYVFILPYVVLFLAFKIIPAIFGVGLSFTNWRPTGGADFVGMDNFSRLFSDPIFWGALRVTLVYAVIAIPMSITVSLFMAVLCDRTLRGMGIYRSIFFLPVVTSSVISGIIWVWIFGQQGPLNWLIGLVGAGPLGWLQSDLLVLPSLAMVSAWSNFGYNMLILLAGMLAIPKDYYEASSLDGANWFQRFRHVTIPLLKPALFFVLILEIIKSFQVFDTIYVMTGGGPVRSSYTLTYMIYDQGFGYFDFGYASAAGVVLLVITLTVSLVQRWLFDKENKK